MYRLSYGLLYAKRTRVWVISDNVKPFYVLWKHVFGIYALYLICHFTLNKAVRRGRRRQPPWLGNCPGFLDQFPFFHGAFSVVAAAVPPARKAVGSGSPRANPHPSPFSLADLSKFLTFLGRACPFSEVGRAVKQN